MSGYTAWRMAYQDAEKAAQAAFKDLALAQREIVRLRELLDAYCGPGTSSVGEPVYYPPHFAGKPRTFAEEVNTAGEVSNHWYARLSDEEKAKTFPMKDAQVW